MYGKFNCELTVHMKMKAELFCELALQNELGFSEGQRMLTHWHPGFLTAKLRPDKAGRIWERKCPVAIDKTRPRASQLVGQSRLRLKDPDIIPAPRFQPTKVPCRLGKVDGELILELSRPLEVASDRSVEAFKRHTSKRIEI